MVLTEHMNPEETEEVLVPGSPKAAPVLAF